MVVWGMGALGATAMAAKRLIERAWDNPNVTDGQKQPAARFILAHPRERRGGLGRNLSAHQSPVASRRAIGRNKYRCLLTSQTRPLTLPSWPRPSQRPYCTVGVHLTQLLP